MDRWQGEGVGCQQQETWGRAGRVSEGGWGLVQAFPHNYSPSEAKAVYCVVLPKNIRFNYESQFSS